MAADACDCASRRVGQQSMADIIGQHIHDIRRTIAGDNNAKWTH